MVSEPRHDIWINILTIYLFELFTIELSTTISYDCVRGVYNFEHQFVWEKKKNVGMGFLYWFLCVGMKK